MCQSQEKREKISRERYYDIVSSKGEVKESSRKERQKMTHLPLMTRNTKKDDVDEDRLQSLPPSKLLYHRTSGVTSTAAAGL